MPCHHTLDDYLHDNIDGLNLRSDYKWPLFRTIGRGIGNLTRTPLPQANAYKMIGRQAARLRRPPRLPTMPRPEPRNSTTGAGMR